ncbi:hypothetical protein COBT_000158 [Conglomerata obtusa]
MQINKLITNIKVRLKLVEKAYNTQRLKHPLQKNDKYTHHYVSEMFRLRNLIFRLEKWTASVESHRDVRYYKQEMIDDLEDASTDDVDKYVQIVDDFEVRKFGYEGGFVDDWSGESCEMKEIAKGKYPKNL